MGSEGQDWKQGSREREQNVHWPGDDGEQSLYKLLPVGQHGWSSRLVR